MFPSCWHRTLPAFTLAVASLFAQSANAAPPQCTLSADPPMVTAGASSTLTASCSPAATSFEWSGGTCGGTISSSCTVTPTVTTSYAVIGTSTGETSTVASTVVFAGGPYDGIYQWDPGYFLSVHRLNGDLLIGTIYWVFTDNTVKVGSRTLSETDSFDLLQGKLVGATATMNGARFYRACILSYDLTFNADSSISVQQKSVSNSPDVKTTDVDCATRYNSAGSRTIPKIF